MQHHHSYSMETPKDRGGACRDPVYQWANWFVYTLYFLPQGVPGSGAPGGEYLKASHGVIHSFPDILMVVRGISRVTIT